MGAYSPTNYPPVKGLAEQGVFGATMMIFLATVNTMDSRRIQYQSRMYIGAILWAY